MEIMEGETRAGVMPSYVLTAVQEGHKVFIENGTGGKSGFPDSAYMEAGANIGTRKEAWDEADIMMKVKQPLEEEFTHFREGLIVACFLHLAAHKPLREALLKSGVTAIDYGTIQQKDGSTPILAAMSKIAGRIAFFDGAKLLMRHKGSLMGPDATILILGLGNAGAAAAELVVKTNPKMLYLLDKNPEKFDPLRRFYQQCSPFDLWFVEHDTKNPSHQQQLAAILKTTDLAIGAAHIPGEKQAKLVPEWMIKNMQPKSILMDIPIDQGGCFETSRETSLRKPTFQKHGVIHYCVPNIPAGVPRESTPALCRESFPYILEIANKGLKQAVRENPALRMGVNVHKGKITHRGLAASIGAEYTPLENLL